MLRFFIFAIMTLSRPMNPISPSFCSLHSTYNHLLVYPPSPTGYRSAVSCYRSQFRYGSHEHEETVKSAYTISFNRLYHPSIKISSPRYFRVRR